MSKDGFNSIVRTSRWPLRLLLFAVLAICTGAQAADTPDPRELNPGCDAALARRDFLFRNDHDHPSSRLATQLFDAGLDRGRQAIAGARHRAAA